MKFNCDKCGLCCQHINRIPQLKEFDSGNGRCIHLTGENLCDIYSTRPDICNVERMYMLFYKDLISQSDFFYLNKKGCNDLKKSNSKNTDAQKSVE